MLQPNAEFLKRRKSTAGHDIPLPIGIGGAKYLANEPGTPHKIYNYIPTPMKLRRRFTLILAVLALFLVYLFSQSAIGKSPSPAELVEPAKPLPLPSQSESITITKSIASTSTSAEVPFVREVDPQIQFLDYLNGEWGRNYSDGSYPFGGSILPHERFDPFTTFRKVHEKAKKYAVNSEYNPEDFKEIAQRARALYIAHRMVTILPKDEFDAFVVQLGSRYPEMTKKSVTHELNIIVSKITQSLYPWINPPFESITAMHSDAINSKNSVGIAITGGQSHFYLIQHLIRSLRTVLDVQLPIEVFYAGGRDMKSLMVEYLNNMTNVKAINLMNYFPLETTEYDKWSLKPYAILASSFKTVLFMDADVLFFRSPLQVLDSEAFRETGMAFFRDRFSREEFYLKGPGLFNEINPHKSLYASRIRYVSAAIDETANTHEMDSGFVAYDKSNLGALHALLLAAKLNGKKERGYLYGNTYGDKESFWFAAEMVRVPYRFNKAYGGVLGTPHNDWKGSENKSTDDYAGVCGISLLQVDDNGRPFWWNGGGVLSNRKATGNFADHFLNLDKIAIDLDGVDTEWLPGHCVIKKKEAIRALTDSEVAIIEKYRNLFRSEIQTLVGPQYSLAQVRILDMMNGELGVTSDEEKYIFGGSLQDINPDDKLDLGASWALLQTLYKKLAVDVEYDRKDFSELSVRARALYIAYRLVHDGKDELTSKLAASAGMDTDELRKQMQSQVYKLTTNLVPWIDPPYKSIKEMHASFVNAKDDVGIVITGGTKHFYLIQHLILSLRQEFDIQQPINVYYAGKDDMHPKMVSALKRMTKVYPVDIMNIFPLETKEYQSWSLKPFAMLAAPFKTILFIDADVLFFKSPLNALKTETFQETGQLFFHDRYYAASNSAKGPSWFRDWNEHPSRYAKTLGYSRDDRESHEMDSGFIVMDKSRLGNLFSLIFAAKMNSKAEREMLYSMTHGDKEAFWFASEMLRVPYRFNTAFGGALGIKSDKEYARGISAACGSHLLQADDLFEAWWWNGGGVLQNREATGDWEFIEFNQMAIDPDGDIVGWGHGFCLEKHDRWVFDLTVDQSAILERYRDIFRKQIKTIII